MNNGEPCRAVLDFADGHQMIMSAEFTDGRPTFYLFDRDAMRNVTGRILALDENALLEPVPKKRFCLIGRHRNGTLLYREGAS